MDVLNLSGFGDGERTRQGEGFEWAGEVLGGCDVGGIEVGRVDYGGGVMHAWVDEREACWVMRKLGFIVSYSEKQPPNYIPL